MDKPNQYIDTLNLERGRWLVGEVNLQLKLSVGRARPAFAVLSDGRKNQKVVLGCGYGEDEGDGGDGEEDLGDYDLHETDCKLSYTLFSLCSHQVGSGADPWRLPGWTASSPTTSRTSRWSARTSPAPLTTTSTSSRPGE